MSAVLDNITDVVEIAPAARPAGGALATAMNPGQLVSMIVQQGGPLNLVARQAAGFTEDELAWLAVELAR